MKKSPGAVCCKPHQTAEPSAVCMGLGGHIPGASAASKNPLKNLNAMLSTSSRKDELSFLELRSAYCLRERSRPVVAQREEKAGAAATKQAAAGRGLQPLGKQARRGVADAAAATDARRAPSAAVGRRASCRRPSKCRRRTLEATVGKADARAGCGLSRASGRRRAAETSAPASRQVHGKPTRPAPQLVCQ